MKNAKFELLDANKQPVTYGKDCTGIDGQEHSSGDAITVTTDENGYAHIEGNEETMGWNLIEGDTYFIHETEAPGGYMLDDTYYQFSISKDGAANYPQFIYYSGDNMSVKNYPATRIEIEKKWSDDEDNSKGLHENDVVTVKLQQRLKKTDNSGWEDWSDVIREEKKDSSGKWNWADTPSKTLEIKTDNNWKAAFNNLPISVPVSIPPTENTQDVDVDYRILETAVNGVAITNTGDGETLKGENNDFTATYTPPVGHGTYISLSVTNTPKVGSLKLKKIAQVNGSTSGDKINYADGTYNFTVVGPSELAEQYRVNKNVSITIKNGAITEVDGATLGNDGYAELSGLKAGTYVITETGWNLDNSDRTISDAMKLTNRAEGVEDVGNNARKVTVVSGKSAAQVEVVGKATFTNNLDLGGLKVNKAITKNGQAPDSDASKFLLSGTYEFKLYKDQACTQPVTVYDEEEYDDVDVTLTVVIKNGVMDSSASNNTVDNIPAGTYYLKETTPSNGSTPTTTNPLTVTISAGSTSESNVVDFSNNMELGSLKIHKNVLVNGTLARNTSASNTQSEADTGTGDSFDNDKPYTFQIWKGEYKTKEQSEEHPFARVQMYFRQGKAVKARYEIYAERTPELVWHDIDAAKLNEDGTVQIDDLVPGTYTIHELEGEKYLPSGVHLVGGSAQGGNNQKVEVTARNTAEIKTASFANDKTVTSNLELSKKLISSTDADKDVPFTFTVELFTDSGLTKHADINTHYGVLGFSGGVATVTLKGGEKKVAEGLPTGLYYRITEASATGFSLIGITNSNSDATNSVGDRNSKGIITKTDTTVEFENKRKEGELKVEKKVANPFGNDATKQFQFEVTLLNSDLTGTYGGMSFDKGVAKFSLTKDAVITATGLPADLNYIVRESVDGNYICSWEGNTTTGTIEDGKTKTETVTNTHRYGDLKVSKTLVGGVEEDATKIFSFEVQLGQSINGSYNAVLTNAQGGTINSTISFTNGKGSFTLNGGQSYTIKDLPYGLSYAVTENTHPDFVLSGKTKDTGTISEATTEARFTNTKNTGGFGIHKEVVSDVQGDKVDRAFEFEVRILNENGTTNTNFNGKYGDLTFENGVAVETVNGTKKNTVTIKHGQGKAVTGISEGTKYQVREVLSTDDSNLFAVTGTNDATRETFQDVITSKVTKDIATMQYVNRRRPGKLTVSKEVITDAAADQNKQFTFKVKLYSAYADASNNTPEPINKSDYDITYVKGDTTTKGKVEFKDGEATVTLTGGQSATIDNLPLGLYYTVEETQLPGFVLTGNTTNPRTNVLTNASTEAFTNTAQTGELELNKALQTDAAADWNQDFTFKITLRDGTINKKYAYDYYAKNATEATTTYAAENGIEFKGNGTTSEATITLKGGEKVRIKGLPLGVEYSVIEVTQPGYSLVSKAGDTGIIKQELSSCTCTYTNERMRGELKLSKIVESDAAADQDQDFTFTVKLYSAYTDETHNTPDTSITKAYDAVFTDARGNVKTSPTTVSFTNGVSENIVLKGDEMVVIRGLPSNIFYTAQEQSANGFTLKGGTGSRVGTISGSQASQSFVNTRDKGGFEISKKVLSALANDTGSNGPKFTFEVNLSDTSISGTYGDLTFTNGKATVELQHNQKAEAKELPEGTTYSITEKNTDNFTLQGIVKKEVGKTDVPLGTTQPSEVPVASNSKPTYEYSNERNKGGFKITKAVVSHTNADKSQRFTFNVKLKNVDANQIKGTGYGKVKRSNASEEDVTFNNGLATITLADGDSAYIENLPIGTEYTVTEVAVDGFTTTNQGGTNEFEGEVTEALSPEHTYTTGPNFINSRIEGNLQLQKYVNSTWATDTADTTLYVFRVELDDKSISNSTGSYGAIDDTTQLSFTNGVATVELHHNQLASITGLPADLGYTVTELGVKYNGVTYDDDHPYDPIVGMAPISWSGMTSTGKGKIVADTNPINPVNTNVVAINRREYGQLDFTKSVVSHTDSDFDKTFRFRVAFYTSDPTGLTDEQKTAIKATGISGQHKKLGQTRWTQFSGASEINDVILKHGETYQVGNLPVGLWYEVEEEAPGGNWTVIKSGETGQIAKSGNVARFTNKQVEGGLYVTKTVKSPLNADVNRLYEFEVTLYRNVGSEETPDWQQATDITGTYNGDSQANDTAAMTFNNGKSTFKLRQGEMAYALNLPVGIKYKVEEKTQISGVVTTVKEGATTQTANTYEAVLAAAGQDQTPSATVEFTNRRELGNLKVEKSNASEVKDPNEEFSFRVELEDRTISGTFGDMTFNNGIATFTLKKNESKSTANGADSSADNYYTLPVGIGYTVTETHADGYTTTWTNKTKGRGAESTATADTYGYTYSQTPVSITGEYGTEWYPKSETKTLTKNDADVEGSTLEQELGSTSKNGEGEDQYTPSNTTSWNDQDVTTGWRTTAGQKLYDPAITANTDDEVVFTNTLEHGSFEVFKRVDSNLTSDKENTRKFSYTVELDDKTVNTSGGEGIMKFENGVANFELADGEVMKSGQLCKGIGYTVYEKANGNFRQMVRHAGLEGFNESNEQVIKGTVGYGKGDYSGEDEELVDDKWLPANAPMDVRKSVGYVNTRESGQIGIAKKVQSDLASDKNNEYKFQVRLTGDEGSKFGTEEDGHHVARFYRVVMNEDYECKLDLNDVIVFTDGVSSDIKLKDNQVLFIGERPSEAFDEDSYDENIINYVVCDPPAAYSSQPQVEYSSNVYGLPSNIPYEVTELDVPDNMSNVFTGQTGAISEAVLARADCTNTRDTGDLSVSKDLISAAMADGEKEFNFKVELFTDNEFKKPWNPAETKDAGNGTEEGDQSESSGVTYGDMTFNESGVATVTLKGGETKTAKDLPVGIYYRITEDDAPGFELTSVTNTNAEATIDKNNRLSSGAVSKTESEVRFSNSRIPAPLTLSKSVISDLAADKDREYTFLVQLSDESINGTYNATRTTLGNNGTTTTSQEKISFSNGFAVIGIKGEESIKIDELPGEMGYTATEQHTPGLKATVQPNTQTSSIITYDQNAKAGFINTREVGNLTVSKELISNREADTDTAYKFTIKLSDETIGGTEGKKYGDMTFKEGKAEVTLKGGRVLDDQTHTVVKEGESATAVGLPTGLTYTIVEDDVEGFSQVGTIGTNGTITTTPSVAKITNRRDTLGDLVFTKLVDDADGVDQNAVYRFTIELSDKTITKTYPVINSGSDEPNVPIPFENGVATVDLKADQAASAVGLPSGVQYTITELGMVTRDTSGIEVVNKPQEYEPKQVNYITSVTGAGDGTSSNISLVEDENRVITENQTCYATITNQRIYTDAKILKVWDESQNAYKGNRSVKPKELKVDLKRSDDQTKPYRTVTLNEENKWTAELTDLPKFDREGTEYIYTWAEPKVDGWTLESMAYSNNGEPAVGVVNAAGYLTTLTNTVDVGSLKLTKHLSGINIASLTDEDKAKITFTVADAAGTTIATNTLDKFTVAHGETDPSWTIEGLPVGTYTVTEANGSKYAFTTTYKVNEGTATTEPAKPVVAKGEIAKVDITNTHKPDKPGFDKKIKDTNDSTGETSDWQDSADYDIGDAVPYKLTATLAKDVTAYKKYHITFTDKMEKSLTYNKDAKITVTGNDGKVIPESEYTVTKVAENEHDFGYTLTWVGENETYIANEALNSAKVEVEFTATLNSDAVLGKQGNVNACKLTFSNNPLSEDDKDEDELPWDYVIAFTYKMDISKVDAQAKALTGAEFKLEKLIKGATEADDKYEEVKRITNGGGEDKNVFTATGLDDGIYRLTETKAPDGYNPIDSLTFTVTAEHGATWDYTSDAKADPAFSPDSRNSILTALTGSEETGMLTLTADSDLSALEGSVINSKEGGNLAVKKKVSSTRSEDKTRNYGFKVTLSDKTINGKYGDMEFKDGVATFTLTHNDTKRAVSLPLNDKGELEYVVEETDAGGLTSSMARPVKSKDGLTHTVTCTNTYKKPTTSTSRTSTAKTGDSTNYIAVGVFAVAGVAILAGALINKRRRSK